MYHVAFSTNQLPIESHNEPLRQAMFARGCEWQVNDTTEHFTLNGQYEDYPIGYIRGPHYGNNGNPRPYSCSVQGPEGWLQMGFASADDAKKWALETAANVLERQRAAWAIANAGDGREPRGE